MKICQICAVDFSLYHMLLPLMKGMRDAGHEVVGVCSDGPLVEKIRAEGFRVETIEIERSLNLLSHTKSFKNLTRFFKNENFDLVHTHTPVASLIARFAARAAGVPQIAYTAHGFYFHENMPTMKKNVFIGWNGWLAVLPTYCSHKLRKMQKQPRSTNCVRMEQLSPSAMVSM